MIQCRAEIVGGQSVAALDVQQDAWIESPGSRCHHQAV